MGIKVFAELGINHNGDMKTVEEMILQSKIAGADAVKFQKRTVKTVYADVWDKPRDDGNPYGWTTYGEQKTGIELSRNDYKMVNEWCKSLGMPWFASAWDLESLYFLEEMHVPYHKVASAMMTNYDFLEAVAKTGKHTFISTGGCSIDHIQTVVYLFEEQNTPFTLLHCVSLYPCPDELCNINAITELKASFPSCSIGYSGHEVGIIPSIVAMALGAEVVERHVTLDRSMYGSDQSASMEFTGLKRLCDYARVVPVCLGDGHRLPSEKEQAVLKSLRYWED